MNSNPLVSVNVLTYNSSKYVLETLESIKAQTYQNIELVISDDKSTDNTVEICKKWTEKNKDRFANIQILVPEKNTGQSGNYNRAFRAATGEWIKEIDGDDILLPNCIEDCMSFVQKDEKRQYLFGKVLLFGGTKGQSNKMENVFDYSFFELSPSNQLDKLLYVRNCIPSAGSFYNKKYIKNIDFECDERIPYLEDWPKWITLLKKGVIFHYIDKEIAMYRISGGISTQRKSSHKYFETHLLFKRYYIYPELLKKGEDCLFQKIIQEESNLYREILDYDKNLRRYLDFFPIKLLRHFMSWRHKLK